MLLALTDQFGHTHGPLKEQAKSLLPRLLAPYDRVYYVGIISERYARRKPPSNRMLARAPHTAQDARACIERQSAASCWTGAD
jgi:hypothetical protein